VPGQEVCKFIVTDAFSGDDTPVEVNVSNKDRCIEITVTNILGTIGDIRGVYFNLRTNGFDTSNIDDTEIEITSWVDNGPPGPDITTVFQCSNNGHFSLISESAQMKGGGAGGDGGREYTCGVEVRQSVFDVVIIDR
jgi:anti-sigma regulatory factor (Ser/Thr protein kinase)